MKNYKQLIKVQRYQIAALLKAGQENKEIAELVGASETTISQELKPNQGQ